MKQDSDVNDKGALPMRSPPKAKTVQLRREGSPRHKVTLQSKSTVSQTRENDMNPSILPIVGILAAATVALGISAMLTDTPLDLRVNKFLDLRVGPGVVLPEE